VTRSMWLPGIRDTLPQWGYEHMWGLGVWGSVLVLLYPRANALSNDPSGGGQVDSKMFRDAPIAVGAGLVGGDDSSVAVR
jgi:hypothetical protein